MYVSYQATGETTSTFSQFGLSLPPLGSLQVSFASTNCSIENAQLVPFSPLSSVQSQSLITNDFIDIFKIPIAQPALEHRVTIANCSELFSALAVFGRADSTFPLLSSSGNGYSNVSLENGTSLEYYDISELSSISLTLAAVDANFTSAGCNGKIVVDARLNTDPLYPQDCANAFRPTLYGDDYTTCSVEMCDVAPACSSNCGSSCAWNAFSVCASSFVPSITGGSASVNSSDIATVTIVGSRFSCDASYSLYTSVYINDTEATIIECSATRVIAVDTNPVSVAGPRNVSVEFALAPCTTFSQTVDYEPLVTSVAPANGPTSGGTLVTIAGKYFEAASVTIGGAVCTVVEQMSTQIKCNAPAGTGAGLDVRVTVAQADALVAGAFSYDAPSVTTSLPTLTTAGGTVTLVGNNFGSSVAKVSVSSSSTLASRSQTGFTVVSVAHTAIQISYPAGTGLGWQWTIDVDGQSVLTTVTSYAAPTVASVVLSGSMLTVTGASFGSSDIGSPLSASLVVAGEQIVGALVSVSRRTDTECVFAITDAGGKDVSVRLTVDGQSVTSSATVDFPAPTITQVGELATLGGELTIAGASFTGNQALVSVALTRSGAELATTVVSLANSQIVVGYPAGVGAGVAVSVQVLNQVAQSSTRYQPPRITNVTSVIVSVDRTDATVNITGANFGTSKDQVSCSLTNAKVTATVLEVSDQMVTAKFSLAEAAFSEASDTLVVDVGGQTVTSAIVVEFSSASLVSVQAALVVGAVLALFM